jgi:WW domain-containing oxidoreductase
MCTTETSFVPIYGDLSSLDEATSVATSFIDLDLPLDVLLCSAGVATLPFYQCSVDGFELQFAINHLAHFQITQLLLPALSRQRGRLVNVTSDPIGIENAKFDLKSPLGLNASNYSMFGAYTNSKLCNVLHAQEVNRRFSAVSALSCTPGTVVSTGIARYLSAPLRFCFKYMGPGLLSKTVEEGASVLAHCVCAPSLVGGAVYEGDRNCTAKICPASGGFVGDEVAALKLWEASESACRPFITQ